MTTDGDLPIAVLGAGIAGLVAALELQRNGYEVRVFEAAPVIAGLGGTHHDDDGFTYDMGAHFITNRLAAAVGVSGECRLVHRYGETVHLDGRYIDYPNGLLREPKFVASALRARISPPAGDPATAVGRFRRDYGRAMSDAVALPILEAWSGAPADLPQRAGQGHRPRHQRRLLLGATDDRVGVPRLPRERSGDPL
jgi:phytoene dehydrogenase-like protein